MQLPELLSVLKRNIGRYLIWLISSLGGLLIPYIAGGLIWLMYREFGDFLPGTDVFLISGSILLTVTMSSYQGTKEGDTTQHLWIGMYLIWPVLLMFVFGIFLAIGLREPTISKWELWLQVILFLALSVIWSSIVWLHERGLIDDRTSPPPKPPTDPGLGAATNDLPKVPAEGGE